MTRTTKLDPSILAEYATAALTRPGSWMGYDDRLYTTHGCVASWADRGDDVLAESNYLSMLAMLKAAVAHDETGRDTDEDVFDGSSSHWLVGSLRELYVRVYADEACTEYTDAFVVAVEALHSLQDYPILDDSDYSEREYEAWQETLDLALSDAERKHGGVDELIDCQAIEAHMTADQHAALPEPGHPDDLRWDDVQEGYEHYRDEYYEARAAWVLGPWPGQLALELEPTP